MNLKPVRGDLKEQKINYPVDLTHQFLLIKDVPAHVYQQKIEFIFFPLHCYMKAEKVMNSTERRA